MNGKAVAMRADPVRLKYVFWQFRCAIWCDSQERWGKSREESAAEYARMYPPPSMPALTEKQEGT